ncbi:TNF receptor-associated factor 4, partial [Desmophyllum pertusum]
MFPLNCVNGCEQVVPRVQMPRHLETDCLLTSLSCPYHDLGCFVKVERRDLERHIQQQTTAHLNLACKKLVQLHLDFDHEKTSLKKQLEELKKENDNLVLKVSVQEKEMAQTRIESPAFVWKIAEFSEILRQAKHGRNNKMDSEPFYTGPYGYKLKLSVNPNDRRVSISHVLVLWTERILVNDK